ncbi:RNA polymerase sigma factor [Methylobacter sp.]|uniref:RNA polymerase sigma factor n=1 Tax=Methylobacter sp. TaxID=2051955 RepID=UPI002FDDF7A4
MPKHSLLHDLFLKHAHEVNAFIRGRWPREQDIDDILQESFLRLSQVSNPETIVNPRAFLFTTASNIAVDHHRRRKTRERYTEPQADFEKLAEDPLSPDRHSEAHQALERFTEWLDELPELHRHAFVLYRIEGCAHAEIASRLGISMSSSERYVKHALQHISLRLGAMHA